MSPAAAFLYVVQLNPGRWIPMSTFRKGASEMDALLSEHLGVTARVCLS